MDERSLQEITRYLQREDAQEKIRQNIAHGRSQITVPIGGAVELFHFSENQLRKWEDKGLLKPQREGRQRHYTLQDLDKLAIIRVLIDAKYSPSDIPPNIDSIWFSMAPSDGQQRQIEQVRPPAVGSESEHLHIDKRIERIDEEAFWRYFISQALRLSIMLICENMPDTLAGLVLPLQKQNTFGIVRSPNDLSKLGDCLIGWLDRNRSFYAFLDSEPSFGFPSDFRVQPLMVIE